MVQSAGRRLSRVERTVVVVSVALVAVFAVMLALRLAGMSQPDGTAAEPTTAAETETPTATPAPPQDLSAVAWDFASPSGNIACDIDGDRALCAIASMEYADGVPAAEKEACEGTVGHVLQVGAEGASLVCDTSGEATAFDAGSLPVLPYGEQAEDEGFTCLSDETGMTCRHDESGYSFSVARAGYDLS
ncbi:hypothetical protein GCM10023169_18120 [Georgenia halophila]|uniref:Serine/threonine protein kinase n=1 Tax=Georgenia halophila TaxID=620889 RepID=A0ABP8L688_9MICO